MNEITPTDLQPRENPGNGWYIIEAAGEHPGVATLGGERVEYVQQLTPDVLAAIAAAGVPDEGLLIDRDHFSRDPEKTSEALGWVRELALCGCNLAARIEWTSLGYPLIEGKVYRHFSTVYPSTPEEMRSGRVTPRRLMGLALTNVPNNAAGQPAITNRFLPPTPGSENQHEPTAHTTNMYSPELLAALGLAEGATPDEVLTTVKDLKARLADAEAATAAAVNAEAEAAIAAEEEKAQVALTEEEKEEVKEELITNRRHGMRYLTLLCNDKRRRQEKNTASPARRYGDTSRQPGSIITSRRAVDEQESAIHNRAHEICRATADAGKPIDYYTARERARRELGSKQ